MERLDITPAFLETLRREVIAYPSNYLDLSRRRSGPVLPPPTAMTWFLGEPGEDDTNVVARVTQTLWWLDTSCFADHHSITEHWALDMFRYTTARFGRDRDDPTAERALSAVCLALAQLFQCSRCWPKILRAAPGWQAHTAFQRAAG